MIGGMGWEGGREVRVGEWLERYDGLRGLSGLKGGTESRAEATKTDGITSIT